MEGFISRRGRPFRGTPFRKQTGKNGFEFPLRKKAEPKEMTAVKKMTTEKCSAASKPATKDQAQS